MTLPWETLDIRELCAHYGREADAATRDAISKMFAERHVLGRHRASRVISCALFCKPTDLGPTVDPPTLDYVCQLRIKQDTTTWWEWYVRPLLRNLHGLAYTFPSVDVHLYLAADLDWLSSALALPGVIVHVMEHSSIAAAPGMMWRFLAYDLPFVEEMSVVDVEDKWHNFLGSPRIAQWRHSELALFRHVNPSEFASRQDICIYRPVGGGMFLLRPQRDFNMRNACEAFAWAAMNGRIPTTIIHPIRGVVSAFGHGWPNYGVDETFLQRVIYPFYLPHGVHTNFGVCQSETLFPLDLAAAHNAHPRAVLTQGM